MAARRPAARARSGHVEHPDAFAGYEIGDRMRRASGHATSDDRGYFRIWDVKPGRYELVLRQFGFGFRGGPPVELDLHVLRDEVVDPRLLRLVGRRVLLAAKRAELEELVVTVEP